MIAPFSGTPDPYHYEDSSLGSLLSWQRLGLDRDAVAELRALKLEQDQAASRLSSRAHQVLDYVWLIAKHREGTFGEGFFKRSVGGRVLHIADLEVWYFVCIQAVVFVKVITRVF